eukprot:c4462_g1_i2.p1 GENE.c4462_g1_i2~~c4462_g1_i2.p1  ORF type:complete len:316 (-),score=67.37 c4462_g1_i2:1007-1954(-)
MAKVVAVLVALCAMATADGLSHSSKDVAEVVEAFTSYAQAHKDYVKALKQHPYGHQMLSFAKAAGSAREGEIVQSLERTHLHSDTVNTNKHAEGSQRVHVLASGREVKFPFTANNQRRSADSLPKAAQQKHMGSPTRTLKTTRQEQQMALEQAIGLLEVETSDQTVAGSDKPWWQNPRPTGPTSVTYDRSNGWWRCSCSGPQWKCIEKSSCVAPEITEEDRLKEEAQRKLIAKSSGGVMPPSMYDGLEYLPGYLECYINRDLDCTWSRDCECLMPWQNVPECRPLQKVPPARCPVKCDKKTWPWSELRVLCTRCL